MLEELKKTAEGTAILKDWLGGLPPVDSALACGRAKICSVCPKNIPGSWWAKATGLVADAIRKQLEFKHQCKLETPLDEKIGTCDICMCNLPLKVWCPAEHIRDHINDEKLEKFPGYCWIYKELKP